MSLVSVRKKGYLYKLPVKGIVKKWNKRWFVLHCTTIEGIVRLEYFDNESFEVTAMGKRTIPLRQCRDISPTGGTKTHPYVFQFTTPMGHHVLAANTHTDMEEWMSSLQEAIMEDRQRNRRKKAQSMIIQQGPEKNQRLSTSGTEQVPVIVQEPEISDVYEPNNSGTYRVTLELNESAKRLKFTGMIYNLDITPEKITLIAADSGAEVAHWRYRQIRTYGKSSGKFNFECGRSAETGQAMFIFKTSCSKEIFGVVHRNIKRIRTQMEHEAPAKRDSQMEKGARLPKQASLPDTQILRRPVEASDFKTRYQEPTKPLPYKPRKGNASSMNVGTYRLSREFGNPPSYEEIAAAEPIKEEKEKEKPTEQPVGQKPQVPDGLYATVDKSMKKKTQGIASQPGAETKDAHNGSSTSGNTSNPLFDSVASNNPFMAPGGILQGEKQEDSFENPFQLDPFAFSPQPGDNSFDVAPGTDPFSIPPLTTDLNQGATGPNVFDDLGQLDSSAGGGFDIFNFGPPITSRVGQSTNGVPTIPPITGNPIGDVSNSDGLNFDVDLLDDRLFDTLAQLDVQGGNEMKQNLTASGQPNTSSPQPHPSFAPSLGTSTSGGQQKQPKPLTQQDFDKMWDGIYSTIPTTDS